MTNGHHKLFLKSCTPFMSDYENPECAPDPGPRHGQGAW